MPQSYFWWQLKYVAYYFPFCICISLLFQFISNLFFIRNSTTCQKLRYVCIHSLLFFVYSFMFSVFPFSTLFSVWQCMCVCVHAGHVAWVMGCSDCNDPTVDLSSHSTLLHYSRSLVYIFTNLTCKYSIYSQTLTHGWIQLKIFTQLHNE